MLVIEPRPLRSDTWTPKQEFIIGPRGLSGSIFCLCGYQSVCLHGGSSCSAGVIMPLFVQCGLRSWDVLGTLRFLLFCRVVANGTGSFLGESRHSSVVWLQRPQPGGGVGHGCADRHPKTQTQLRFGAEVMAGLIYSP